MRAFLQRGALWACAMAVGAAAWAQAATRPATPATRPTTRAIEAAPRSAAARSANAATTRESPTVRAQLLYENDFTTIVGSDWSQTRVGAAPSTQKKFLGEFGQEAVTLTLTRLPAHKFVKVEMTLFLLRSWDGLVERSGAGGATIGPDVWEAAVAGGPVLLRATFSNRDGFDAASSDQPGFARQSYPDQHGGGDHPGRTASADKDSLGYTWGIDPTPCDATYRLVFRFPHGDPALKLVFRAPSLQNVTDESWGIADIKVEGYDASPVGDMDAGRLGALWELLGDRDPVKAAEALWAITCGGDATIDFLRHRLAESIEKVDPAAVRKHLADLDHVSPIVREDASAALRRMGTAAEPALLEAEKGAASEEVRARVKDLLADLAKSRAADSTSLRIGRAVHALQVMGGSNVKQLLKDLAAKADIGLTRGAAARTLELVENRAKADDKLGDQRPKGNGRRFCDPPEGVVIPPDGVDIQDE